jgi:hypothetical protein
MNVILSRHAVKRLAQRRRNFKAKNAEGQTVSGTDAALARLTARIHEGRVHAEPPSWYEGNLHEGGRYVMLTPTLCAAVVRGRGRQWICTTIMTDRKRAA